MTDDNVWPATCRCGFEAKNREQAEAHAILEHPEALSETGKVVHEAIGSVSDRD